MSFSIPQIDVVVAHFMENLKWIKDIDRRKYQRVMIISKTLKDGADIHQPINFGREASSYLEYLVKYYDDLPRIL